MCDKKEFSITTLRFRKLIDNEKYAQVPRTKIAKANDCDTSTITKYYNGQRQLSVESVIKFSKYFNVSSDYLLGLTDVESTDTEIKSICTVTGLNECSVNILNELNNDNTSVIAFADMIVKYINENKVIIDEYLTNKKYVNELFTDILKDMNFNDIIKTKKIDENISLPAQDTINKITLWKEILENRFFSSQYRLNSSFDKLINNSEIVEIINLLDDFYKTYSDDVTQKIELYYNQTDKEIAVGDKNE